MVDVLLCLFLVERKLDSLHILVGFTVIYDLEGKNCRNLALLSFGDEAEEDEEELTAANAVRFSVFLKICFCSTVI